MNIYTKKEVKPGTFMHIHLVTDKEICALNKKHRNKNYPTDVLSFEMNEPTPDGKFYLGDVIVNIDQAKRQMEEYGHKDVRDEISDLAAHGILHLLGVDHEGEKIS